jgi:hypothetical protein
MLPSSAGQVVRMGEGLEQTPTSPITCPPDEGGLEFRWFAGRTGEANSIARATHQSNKIEQLVERRTSSAGQVVGMGR